MKCCSLVLHCGQANDRKSWPHMLGSIEVNLMGEPQAEHNGPWFCLSSIGYPLMFGARRSLAIDAKPALATRSTSIASTGSR
jgi:hypothetical protein